MMLRRATLVLATLTALMAAPSAVLGADPNALLGAAATPTAGTTDTVFSLSVQYVSAEGSPAGSVTATVAGRTLSLSLLAGSATSGTWGTATRLPAGTWPTAFDASPATGKQPSEPGPTILVTAAVPVVPGGPAPPSNQVDGEGTVTPDATSPTAAPAAPVATPATDPAPSNPVAELSEVPSPTPAGAAPGGSSSETTGTSTPSRPPVAAAGGASSPSPAAPANPVASPGVATKAGASPAAVPLLPPTPLGEGSEAVWTLMIGGLVAVGAVAVIGSAWLAIGRRRQPAAIGPADEASPTAQSLPDTTDELLSRRTRNRTRIRATDDPVLAAMGLDEPPRRRPGVAPPADREARTRDTKLAATRGRPRS